ncbi:MULTISPECIES: IS256 family transposase [unclassified Fusibacter]|uniref:IS256 family transposase n=1 Tax=unclassified Fusibacter TaxID=2624464 RepID=UPI001011DC71|nr:MULTISPECIES: IS256 family transposase [unclassified Fusibacter]MCK8058445.1 IS256 family transposase [Fusibacter sp. A2]NPE22787.1 IS256 family transposase [Fusibacter sp. A1]
MAKRKKNPASKQLMEHLFENYEIKTALDVQEALKDMFAETLENMLEAELDEHLGYDKNEHGAADTTNRRNGKTQKKVLSQLGDIELNVPRDRESSFEPQIVKKGQKDVTGIEEKVLSMYGRGQSQRDIEATINEIYGFNMSHETVSKITDKIIPQVNEFRSRALKPFYPFVFVDAMYVPCKTEHGTGQKALYNIVGIDVEGRKEVLGFWLSEGENSREWLQILEEIKRRGVEDILFISLDGLPGLQDAIQVVYPNVNLQRCIVHLMRNATRYIPRKDWVKFAKDIKAVYRAVSLDEAKVLFDEFKKTWAKHGAAVAVWEKNWTSIENLFTYPENIRKLIYTTNTIESYHNQLRKVTSRKGAFPNEMSLFKLLFLRINDIQNVQTVPLTHKHQSPSE